MKIASKLLISLRPTGRNWRELSNSGGRVGGRKPKLNEKQIREIKTLLTDPAAQVKHIAERYGVSRTTLYKRVGVVQSLK